MDINDNISSVKGIGPRKSALLKKLNIKTIDDFLHFFPRDYEDRRNIRKISSLKDQEVVLVRGKVLLMIKGKNPIKRKQTLKLLIEDETSTLEVVFFNAGFIEKNIKINSIYDFYGKTSFSGGKIKMIHPDYNETFEDESLNILPIYPLTAGLTQNEMRKWQRQIQNNLEFIDEYIPLETIERHRLCGIKYALDNIHFPLDKQKLLVAKYRLIFEELLFLQTGLLLTRNKMKKQESGIAFSEDIKINEYVKDLPYDLTNAQKRVLCEIEKDMESFEVMNRLVQGDVGSGKTVVAAGAIYKAAKSGYQAVFMAPTEILARQHYKGLKSEFDNLGLEAVFLSGNTPAKDKKDILKKIENGEANVIIGTHAVIQASVNYFNLGLVITDEQHRFGVNQRALLNKKGNSPDVIVMTATPIPRTLAVILYGDLDISIIDEMPPGRQKIVTKAVEKDGRDQAYEFIRREIKKGRQAYVVAPLIEDSENLNAKSTMSLYEEINDKFFDFNVAFLHGAMKQSQKDEVMADFNDGKIDILISTVVIEVGINVPNATIMLIENAERFGLAQLHQLRGRVGRGTEQSYCILVSDSFSEIAKERAEIMKSTNDGFIIAEKDMEIRGPGEFFGTKQHGVPELKLADLVKHIKILNTVKEESNIIINSSEMKINGEFEKIVIKIEEMFSGIDNLNI